MQPPEEFLARVLLYLYNHEMYEIPRIDLIEIAVKCGVADCAPAEESNKSRQYEFGLETEEYYVFPREDIALLMDKLSD